MSGEVAGDMSSGLACSLCGVYFTRPHGYPVLCVNCWAIASPEGQGTIQRATIEELE